MTVRELRGLLFEIEDQESEVVVMLPNKDGHFRPVSEVLKPVQPALLYGRNTIILGKDN